MIELTSLEQTVRLARAFASCLPGRHSWPALLMRGQLGAGKTTFVRELVQALPGSEGAEVSSPSFNLLNLYPTVPLVGHFDLYRTSGLEFGPDLEEILFSPEHFCLMEWAEFLPDHLRPDSCIDLGWTVDGDRRSIVFTAHGHDADDLLRCALTLFHQP